MAVIKIELELEIDELITLRNFLDESLLDRGPAILEDESKVVTDLIEILDNAIDRHADATILEKNNKQNIMTDYYSRHLKG